MGEFWEKEFRDGKDRREGRIGVAMATDGGHNGRKRPHESGGEFNCSNY
ncbi:hypothetical protein ACJIZ3_023371 [Penstemon smallii]|uniref:Uncharacterized protein n=1 Tax=Penstemon smallii TaxID=265156 RepID=A0ABD3TRA0_9LAMI